MKLEEQVINLEEGLDDNSQEIAAIKSLANKLAGKAKYYKKLGKKNKAKKILDAVEGLDRAAKLLREMPRI